MNNAIQKLPTYIQEKVSTAIVPIKYVEAIKALEECRNIDDAKYFADKADALAAWAKIYKHNDAVIEAKRLKLHAYRRMGLIASELMPLRKFGGNGGTAPGARSLLMGMGLSKFQAHSISAVTRLPEKKFLAAVDSNTPPSPSFYLSTHTGQSKSWQMLHGRGPSAGMMTSFCRKYNPKEIARGLTPSEAIKAREMALEITEWMDTFEQYLPKKELTPQRKSNEEDCRSN